MSATLKLTHRAIGAEVRRGTYDVVLDGEGVGSVKMNDTFETPVEPGRHTLQVRNGRKSSRTKAFDAKRRRNRRLPMHRKEHLADFSPVLRRSEPGTFAQARVTRINKQIGSSVSTKHIHCARSVWGRHRSRGCAQIAQFGASTQPGQTARRGAPIDG